MKPFNLQSLRLFRITVAILCALVVGTSFLTPERETVLPRKRGGGEFIFEYKGKKYVATERDGTATIGADKKAFVFFSGEFKDGNRFFRLQFNFYPMQSFKTGKLELTSQENHMDKHLKDGCVLVVFTTEAENADQAPPENPADISGDSDAGIITLTNIATNDADHSATISGSFEFSGKNDYDYGSDKSFSIKGTFKNFEVTYANMSKS